jgi:hypothetical protein
MTERLSHILPEWQDGHGAAGPTGMPPKGQGGAGPLGTPSLGSRKSLHCTALRCTALQQGSGGTHPQAATHGRGSPQHDQHDHHDPGPASPARHRRRHARHRTLSLTESQCRRSLLLLLPPCFNLILRPLLRFLPSFSFFTHCALQQHQRSGL